MQPLLTPGHFERFTNEGFKLVGQVATSSGRPNGEESSSKPAGKASPAKSPGVQVHKGDRIKAYRVTKSGHVYVKQ